MPLRLRSMTIQGFRCFGPEGVAIDLEEATCLIGPNGSGKSAVLLAIRRMFGVVAADRRVRPEDFYLQDDEQLAGEDTRSLRIEGWFETYTYDADDDAADDDTAAAVFDHMVIEKPGGELYVRVELAAVWTDDGTVEGDIEQQLSWITTASDEPGEVEKCRRKVAAADRALIRAIYVSAVRDPSTEIRAVAGTGLDRLLRSATWSEALRELLADQSESLADQLSDETALGSLRSALRGRWSELYRGSRLAETDLKPPRSELFDVVAGLRPTFSAAAGKDAVDVSALSDGFKSLFSLAFTVTLLDVEERVRAAAGDDTGFDQDFTHLPVLTLLLVEEPENHVSPHHLGRVVEQLRRVSESPHSQVLLTSHAPGVVRRVYPGEIRYCLGNETTAGSRIKKLVLPEDAVEEAKFVRQAVQGFPELYFSRLVVLGEGPSEEIILRRYLQVVEHEVDAEQISIVPLGGRHVQHFWRLLDDLEVPYVTLLDLDRGRTGGGWNRIKYVIEQLIAIGKDRNVLLAVQNDDGTSAVLSPGDFDKLGKRDDADEDLDAWVEDLERYGVFFSAPLDIDHSMLQSFLDVYKSVAQTRPRTPTTEPDRGQYRRRAAQAVLGEDGDVDYYSNQLALFPWYRSLFIHESKPSAHLMALASLDDKAMKESCPEPIEKLIRACREALKPSGADSNGAS